MCVAGGVDGAKRKWERQRFHADSSAWKQIRLLISISEEKHVSNQIQTLICPFTSLSRLNENKRTPRGRVHRVPDGERLGEWLRRELSDAEFLSGLWVNWNELQGR